MGFWERLTGVSSSGAEADPVLPVDEDKTVHVADRAPLLMATLALNVRTVWESDPRLGPSKVYIRPLQSFVITKSGASTFVLSSVQPQPENSLLNNITFELREGSLPKVSLGENTALVDAKDAGLVQAAIDFWQPIINSMLKSKP